MTRLLLAMALLAPMAPQDRADVPLEVEPADPSAAKIVLLAGSFSKGGGEHEYFAGSAVLMKVLRQTPGVFPVFVAEGWPKNERIFEGARTVVFYMDGGGKQPFLTPGRLGLIEKLAARGVGIVHLHQVIDYPKAETDRVLPLLGGVYVPQASARGHWDGDFKDFVEHPVTRGVKRFVENDGFLYKLRFVDGMKGVTPLLRTSPKSGLTGTEDVVSWAYSRPDGGRTFAFTGCHAHVAWGLEGMRRFVVNGILWSAGQEIPTGGAPVALEPDDLKRYLDPKPPKK